MQSGLQFDMKQFDIFHSVQETIEVMKVTSKTHEIVLTGSTTKTVYGDENRIGQVLTNLLSNAIKYSPGKQKIVVSISERRRGIAITIQDFGIGIDDTNKQKIFDKFYRVAGGDERTFPGLGIGLYICREIVARHKGKLWVESKKGEGSIFYMVIPYSPEGPTLS
jgi:signal transduction histidine kinase